MGRGNRQRERALLRGPSPSVGLCSPSPRRDEFADLPGRIPMSFLTKDELDALMPAEMLPHTTPLPTQIVSSDEYIPAPQREQQKQVEARLLDMSDELGRKQGLDRRQFFQTAAGMAAAFVAMNDTFGAIFDVSKAEAATPAMAQERANALKDQF